MFIRRASPSDLRRMAKTGWFSHSPEVRIAAMHSLMRNAAPLSDVSKLRYQAVFLMGAGGSGKGFVGTKWMKYRPGNPDSKEDAKKNYTQAERGLTPLDFAKVQDALRKKGIELEVAPTGDASIPFKLYDYDASGRESLIPPEEWDSRLPADLAAQVKGLQKAVFSDPKHEEKNYWRQVNPDIYKEELAGYSAKQPGYVHEMSSEMAKAYFQAALLTGDPLFVDGTGANAAKMAQQMNEAKNAGYSVSLVFVSVPMAVSQIRNALRERNVKAEELVRQWKSIRKNYPALKSVADKATVIDNRNDAIDYASYEKNSQKINSFIQRSSGGRYQNLYELLEKNAPDELAQWGEILKAPVSSGAGYRILGGKGEVSFEGNSVVVRGSTFPIVKMLKGFGFQLNPKDNSWSLPRTSYNDKIEDALRASQDERNLRKMSSLNLR